MPLTLHYFGVAFFRGALPLYVIYRVIYRGPRKIVELYQRGAAWKAVALGVVAVLCLVSLPIVVWVEFKMTELPPLNYGASLLVGFCLGVVVIWLERRYYPDQ